ncbi:transcriptional regulator [Salmonella enterica subsp. enterica serovar Choleraesuis]|nr:transcriptional regulator [Salmonella enterica subsp. enterica serovar Choleraesuis]
MSIFKLNDAIYFDSTTNKIWRKGQYEHAQLMNAASSVCFTLLLNSKGDIVLKKTVFEQVWDRYGLIATDNSYHQTVLHLRNILRQAGLDRDVIKTVPRKGLSISSALNIEIITEAELQQELQSQPSQVTEAEDSEQVSAPEQGRPKPKNGIMGYFTSLKVCGVCILAALIPSIWIGYYYSQSNNFHMEPWSWEEYTPFDSTGACTIFINKGFPANNYNVQNIAQRAGDCQRYPYVYITRYDPIKRESIISCTRPVSDKNGANDCISQYRIVK